MANIRASAPTALARGIAILRPLARPDRLRPRRFSASAPFRGFSELGSDSALIDSPFPAAIQHGKIEHVEDERHRELELNKVLPVFLILHRPGLLVRIAKEVHSHGPRGLLVRHMGCGCGRNGSVSRRLQRR
jgi:hypothetical protein